MTDAQQTEQVKYQVLCVDDEQNILRAIGFEVKLKPLMLQFVGKSLIKKTVWDKIDDWELYSPKYSEKKRKWGKINKK